MTAARFRYLYSWGDDIADQVTKAVRSLDHHDVQVQFLTTVVPGPPPRRGTTEPTPPRVLREAYITYTGPDRF